MAIEYDFTHSFVLGKVINKVRAITIWFLYTYYNICINIVESSTTSVYNIIMRSNTSFRICSEFKTVELKKNLHTRYQLLQQKICDFPSI